MFRVETYLDNGTPADLARSAAIYSPGEASRRP
jgi:hypothetical protein